MERKKKKCKGTGRAINNGCGVPSYIHRYGLCLNCFKVWLFGTTEGKKVLESTQIRAKKQSERVSKAESRNKKEEARTRSYYIRKLQDEVNAIVRLIDIEKGCISCDHGWGGKITRQFHAGHRISVGSNPTLRFHFSNIFKQCSICNNYKSGNERAYDKGLLKHYGAANLEIVQSLPAKFKSIHLTIPELIEKITIAWAIKKEILSGSDFTRRELNERLGIYQITPIEITQDH